MRKKVTYPKPENCRVCKKGIYCPIHPNNRLNCRHHKLKHIIEKEEQILEEEKKQEEEEKKKKKKKDFENAGKIWN